MTILTNILALIVVLSVLVVVHEFGHFAVAKYFGFPVEVFSVGFGKRLFGKKWRGTDYRVSAIPLGGYVRVIGLGPDESTVTDGTSQEAPPVGKRWQRALVLLAGPLMNLVLALALYTAVFAIGTRVPKYELELSRRPRRRGGLAGRGRGIPAGRPHPVDQRQGDPAVARRPLPLRDERPGASPGRGRARGPRPDIVERDAPAGHEVRPGLRRACIRTSAPASGRGSPRSCAAHPPRKPG